MSPAVAENSEPPRVRQQQEECDDAPAQDRHRIAVEVEHAAVEPRVLPEILRLAHFRPRRVDAQRDDGEKQIHDPDAEYSPPRPVKTIGTT